MEAGHNIFFIDLIKYFIYFLNLLVLYFIGLWVFQDADRRGINGYFWCILCIFFPIGAVPIYLLLRPKRIIKQCPDCDRFEEKDSVLCYYCPYNCLIERPPFRIYVFSLLTGLCKSVIMTVRFFFFMNFNGLYERIFLLRDSKIRRMNFLLKYHYFLKSPVRIARKSEQELMMPYFSMTYGETPYSTIHKLFNMVDIKEGDIFFDLGSGIGNVVFFVNMYFKIPSVGVELVPFFMEKSRLIARELNLNDIDFIQGDFLREDISQGSIFYMNGKTFNLEIIERLFEKFKSIKKGSRLITVGYPIIVPYFKLLGDVTMFFSWGWDDVYIHEKII